jgi:hypothetical protein
MCVFITEFDDVGQLNQFFKMALASAWLPSTEGLMLGS